MGYTIYMHIFPNSKKYIGITSREPEKRWLIGKNTYLRIDEQEVKINV